MKANFWEGYVRPGKVFGNIYFVGTRPASSHLIDTGDGLILLDAGFPEAIDGLLENIRSLGFDPMDIRIILLSHGHYDHAAAAPELARMTGAKIYLGEKDLKMVTGEEDSSLAELFDVKYTQFFTPDVLLEDGDHVTLGNTDILCLSTPGHTDGTMSFFFDVTDGEACYRAGMFGGAGTNTLTGEFLASHGLPLSERDKFFASVDRLKKESVEVFLGNHVGNNDTVGKLARVESGEANAFVAPDEWSAFLNEREARMNEIIKKEKTMNALETILKEKAIMIVRGVSADKIIDLAEAMWRGGIRLMECTYDATGKTPDEETARIIGSLVERFKGRMLIGAGTVLTKKQVQLTAAAGGEFIISPDTNAEIIAETKKLGLVSIPGALTPSEATAAHRAGADFVKLFPINQLGVGYLKALCAPLSHIRFLAVGGVRPDNIADFIAGGARGIGMGLNANDKAAIDRGDFDYIENMCKEITSKLK